MAAEHDQAGSDHDPPSGTNPAAHQFSRDIRQRIARQREHIARARLDAGAQRDQVANTRDLAALARDQASAARDLAMTQREIADTLQAGARVLPGASIVIRAVSARRRAAQRRAQAVEHHALATQDRRAAARDREQAARERRQALADREALARQVAVIETDPLTGAHPRAAGLLDLDHELQRCSRTSDQFVIAYVDVVAAPALIGSQDHSAVDELLTCAVAQMHEHLRSYDLIIRLGDTQLLCGMSNMTLPVARERFGELAAAIAVAPGLGAIATGFAALTSHETAAELIARADLDLVATRRITENNRPQTTAR